ncbi:LuxR C-terminal-related transcriptional regulator [Streptomyces sp. NPDC058525]|uniref:helix-turn-helix transcriptional regulator n=1 Tax=Streptomyces sp. NPDC058525 TaxID=3346538 RepID=UPI0036651E5F
MKLIHEEMLKGGPHSPSDLASSLGLTEHEAHAAVGRLLEIGLLRPEDQTGTYVSTATDVAQTRLLGSMQHSLRSAQVRIAEASLVLAALGNAYASTPESTGEDFLHLSAADVNAMLEEDAATCSSSLLTAQPGGPRPAEALAQARIRDVDMVNRGVRMRTIYQHSARYSTATEAFAERLTQAGAEIRTLATLFPRLIIFDQRIAFIPGREGSSAVRIREPSVVAFLTSAFEIGWNVARPFASAYETRREKVITSDMQRAIARLFLEEDKDSAIARRLGISERSCRAHVSKMMTSLGARNRTHLGYLLAQEMGQL